MLSKHHILYTDSVVGDYSVCLVLAQNESVLTLSGLVVTEIYLSLHEWSPGPWQKKTTKTQIPEAVNQSPKLSINIKQSTDVSLVLISIV